MSSAVRGGNHTSTQIFQHALQIAHDVVIPITNDLIAGRLQARRTFGISAIVRMLSAIRLDDDPQFLAQEIGDKIGNRRLPAEFEAQKPAPPKHSPERSEEHTSELQSLMRISYAVFC